MENKRKAKIGIKTIFIIFCCVIILLGVGVYVVYTYYTPSQPEYGPMVVKVYQHDNSSNNIIWIVSYSGSAKGMDWDEFYGVLENTTGKWNVSLPVGKVSNGNLIEVIAPSDGWFKFSIYHERTSMVFASKSAYY